jgi:hypothetical protein
MTPEEYRDMANRYQKIAEVAVGALQAAAKHFDEAEINDGVLVVSEALARIEGLTK